jgi:uncharacterized protein
MTRFLPLLLLCAGVPAMAAEPIDAAAHRAGVEAWHAARIERLQRADGWLSLVGLHWIEPGRHRIGSAADNDIVLNTGPAVLGVLERDGDSLHLTPAADAGVVFTPPADGRVRLLPDSSGTPTVVHFDDGKASFLLIERSGRYALRVRDAAAPTLTGFQGIERFPVDPAWRIDARFVAHPPGKTIDIASVINTLEPMANPGALEFEVDGTPYRLETILESPDDQSLFVIFADRSNRSTTYGAGRFVYTEGLPADGRVVLDFNKAYNPPCALNAYSTCPLPPPENRLDLSVDAGEKRYAGPY